MKKFLGILLICSLVLGNFGVVFADTALSDVAGLPCEEAVKALSEAGIINGYTDGDYQPLATITRAEASKLIIAALGFEDKELSATGNFTDTKGHWAEKYIAKCKELGIINGYEDGTFRPDETITYDEIITMLIRALGYNKLDGVWPENYINMARQLGILGNVMTGSTNANRGDVAILLYQTWTKPIGSMDSGKWVANPDNDTMKKRTSAVIPNSSSTSNHHSNHSSDNNSNVPTDTNLKDIVAVMKNNIEGEEAFDYLSYVYMGWRTTGGPWQNHVIQNYLMDELKDAGYVYSKEDMSDVSDKDYIWVQHDNSDELVWAPQFASLTVTSEGDTDLIKKFNVVSYSYDPTCDIYMDYYGKQYGVDSIDDMYTWITEKKSDGTRTNVANGSEAELNKRAHLARNSCFTDQADTSVESAKGVEGEVTYIGKVNSATVGGIKVLYGSKTGLEGNADLKGKVLLSDSQNSATFRLAKQVEAVAVMSTSSLSNYNNPTIDGETWYTDSARYAGGASAGDSMAAMKAGNPIVQWNLSLDQRESIMGLLANSETTKIPVKVKSVSIGDIYSMAYEDKGEGQLTAIAEIKGTTKANERVIFMAHVQEPGACDNASGVGLQIELALKLKKMIDSGVLKRPERTITFVWGDEMTCAELWLNAHPEEKKNVVGTIDLDMVGEDTEKTGGTMRIEKTPDPSAFYNYTLDVLPGEDPYTDSEEFVRLPDSHTLWGAGEPPEISALYINDLYMAATQEVIRSVDPKFKVAVCPFEGGSDHEVFLNAGIPAVLTWHFTDYVYHTTVDTLDKASAREMENVGITSLSAGYMAAIAKEYQTNEMMNIIYNAAVDRFKNESQNTLDHYAWAKANDKDIDKELALELDILNAWGAWYIEALESCQDYFLKDAASETYKAQEASYITKINQLLKDAKDSAEDTFAEVQEKAS